MKLTHNPEKGRYIEFLYTIYYKKNFLRGSLKYTLSIDFKLYKHEAKLDKNVRFE